jgi:hypothetical protein
LVVKSNSFLILSYLILSQISINPSGLVSAFDENIMSNATASGNTLRPHTRISSAYIHVIVVVTTVLLAQLSQRALYTVIRKDLT